MKINFFAKRCLYPAENFDIFPIRDRMAEKFWPKTSQTNKQTNNPTTENRFKVLSLVLSPHFSIFWQKTEIFHRKKKNLHFGTSSLGKMGMP